MKTETPFSRSLLEQSQRRRYIPLPIILCVLSISLLLALLLSVSVGSTAIPLATIVKVVLNGTRLFHFVPSWDSSIEVIIWNVRMPVVVGSALVGAALAVAGALFQGILRNPLADPFLIGTSSGAALGATLSFILPVAALGTLFPATAVLAFVGAILTVLFVYALARVQGQTPVVTLLLAGVVVNSVLVALQTLLLSLFPRADFPFQALFNWLSGEIAVTSWYPVLIAAVLVLLGLVLALSLTRVLDALALGEESATALGLNVEAWKFGIVVVASLMTAAAVSISGLIGFVGLVTPHVMRLLLGPEHRSLLPASALGGAIFLILADLLSRTVIAPAVLPVGIFTALVGAPFFLFLLRRSKREYRW